MLACRCLPVGLLLNRAVLLLGASAGRIGERLQQRREMRHFCEKIQEVEAHKVFRCKVAMYMPQVADLEFTVSEDEQAEVRLFCQMHLMPLLSAYRRLYCKKAALQEAAGPPWSQMRQKNTSKASSGPTESGYKSPPRPGLEAGA